jgi:predicted Ser/Thr protein kinase
MQHTKTLKQDALGTVARHGDDMVVRDTAQAATGRRWLARRLAMREAAALERLQGIEGIPLLLSFDGSRLCRTYLQGEPMHRATFEPAAYFRDALALLRTIHARGVAHNDLAKEANWICMPGNRAGIVDFQLATIDTGRGLRFRRAAREDLRHLLKHKRHYAAERLSQRERAMLARPLLGARLWRICVKPVYLFITRRLLGWPERTGAEERQWRRSHADP